LLKQRAPNSPQASIPAAERPYHLVDHGFFTVDGRIGAKGLLMGPLPTPDDESTEPSELVPGTAAPVPKAPPVTDV
jgi:hypothetical protein